MAGTLDRRRFLVAVTTAALSAGWGLRGWAASHGPAVPAGADAPANSDAGPTDIGLSEADLGTLMNEARQLAPLHAIVVTHRAELRLAEALRGPSVDTPVNVKSVSKTLVSLLAGMARDRGVFESVDESLGDLVPGLLPDGADPRVSRLSLEELLTMRAGLERTSGRRYGAWVTSDDWVDYALTRRFVAEPGTRMLYSTGTYHVLGAVLAELSGKSLYAMARDWLGDPLDIDVLRWTRDPQGRYLGGNEMALSPLAMVRVGEMCRLGGRHDGSPVVYQDWLDDSWTARTMSPYSGHGYGYGWFIASAYGHAVYYARGYGGQMLYIVPSLELTVAITSDATQPARSRGYAGALHALVAERVVLPLVGRGRG